MTCDVIGHYVMVKPDIPHERSRSKLYEREVSWWKNHKIRNNSRFISTKSSHFLIEIQKNPTNPRGRAEDGTLNLTHYLSSGYAFDWCRNISTSNTWTSFISWFEWSYWNSKLLTGRETININSIFKVICELIWLYACFLTSPLQGTLALSLINPGSIVANYVSPH